MLCLRGIGFCGFGLLQHRGALGGRLGLLPVDGGGKVHEGNALTGLDLGLQVRHGGRVLCAVVDNAVYHVLVVLHGHLRVFQGIVIQKAGQLLESHAITVMT